MTAKTVASKKQKGRLLQQYVVQSLLRLFPSLTVNDLRSVPASVPGTDIWMSEAAKKCIEVDDIECKNSERINMWGVIKQLEDRCFTSIRKLIIFKRNRSDVWVTMPFDYYIELLRKVNYESKRECASDTRSPSSFQSQECVGISN